MGILESGFTLHPVFPIAATGRLLIFLLINQNNFGEKNEAHFLSILPLSSLIYKQLYFDFTVFLSQTDSSFAHKDLRWEQKGKQESLAWNGTCRTVS